MKLFAARAVDITDLSIIWSACGFESPEQAADLYHAAYPHLEWDEYLVDEIRAIGEHGSGARTIRLGDVDPRSRSHERKSSEVPLARTGL